MVCDRYSQLYESHMGKGRFLDSSINSAVIDKISKIQEMASNFTFSQKS